MEWVKLVAQPAFYLDAALLRAGESAEVLFTRGLAYCGGSDTRGRIDKTVLPMIVGRPEQRALALVREGLWIDRGDHYVVRSWDRWQDEHDRAAAVRRGNRERQRRLRDRVLQDSRSESPDVTRDVTVSSRVTSRAVSRDVTALDVDVDVEGEETRTQPTTSVVATLAKTTAARGTRIPENWPADADRDRLWQWALDAAPAVAIGPETANWQDWHRAKGDTAKDWCASWRTWMRRAQADAERRPASRAPRSTTDDRVNTALALVEHYAREEGA